MTAQQQGRGHHLIAAGRGFVAGGMVARLLRGMPDRVWLRIADRFDAAFGHGTLTAVLPGGATRILGGRGPGPIATLHLNNWSAVLRLLSSGSVGWYRAWTLGEWSSSDPVALFALFSANRRALLGMGRARGPVRWLYRALHTLRRNTLSGSRRNIAAHYDLGNDFYAAWLDAQMLYSSAMYRGDGDTIEAAQIAKIDAALDRLNLRPDDRLLEIGCGWGALGRRAIDRHGVAYHGLTLSVEQAQWARRVIGDENAISLRDYRDESGVYDAIASIEMVEAVGRDYWPAFLNAVAQRLRPGGRAAIQFIAMDPAVFDNYAANADFIQTYIFPGGCLINVPEFRALAEQADLQWCDQHDFGDDYARTLQQWRERYETTLAQHPVGKDFPPEFHALWRYYLMYCEGGFRGGGITVSQVTLLKVTPSAH